MQFRLKTANNECHIVLVDVGHAKIFCGDKLATQHMHQILYLIISIEWHN